VARVRQQSNVGVMADAFADEAFCRAVVEAIGANRELPCAHGKLHFVATRGFAELAGSAVAKLPVSRPQPQSSNTVVTLGERLFLKGYRQLRPGINPEFEVGRFLTEVAHFPNCAPVAGAIEYAAADGTSITLALLQAYVPNQGDGWSYTQGYLERHFETQLAAPQAPPADVHGAYLSLIHTLGMRTAELHLALARRSGDPAFDPEPLAEGDLADWKKRVRDDALATLAMLEQHLVQFHARELKDARTLLDERQRLLASIDACAMSAGPAAKTRYHGDYHLGQVLIRSNDFVIIDFEGEPARSLPERRMKHSPLRDVAGMLRSFDYARWSALRRAAEAGLDGARLAPLAAAWEGEVHKTFLRAYEEAARGGGLFDSFEQVRGLLALFELEKALYGLRYEINNRPAWVGIALHGVLPLSGLTPENDGTHS